MLDVLQDRNQKRILVPQVLYQKGEAFNCKVDDMIGLIVLTQKWHNVLHNDCNVLAQERLENFEEMSETHQCPLGLIGILSFQQFHKSLEELFKLFIEVFSQVLG